MKTPLKNLRIYALKSLLSVIHQHYAWPDKNLWDGTFKCKNLRNKLQKYEHIVDMYFFKIIH
jgi:hypothetical protein